MNEIYMKMSEELEGKLSTLETSKKGSVFMLEEAIGLCTLTLLKMKELLNERGFNDDATEIEFFKHIKPRVYGKLMFFVKLLKIETRRPHGTKDVQVQYLMKCINQLEQIYDKYDEFYKYYRLKQSSLDEIYFLRESMYNRLDLHHVYHLMDKSFSTAQDYVLALFIAHEHLIYRLGQEIQQLNTGDSRSLENDWSKQNNDSFEWTDSKVAMVELIYALHSTQSVNKGKFSIKELAKLFETIFNIELGDVYRIFLEVRTRKVERAKYIDYLKNCLLRRMDDWDNKDLNNK